MANIFNQLKQPTKKTTSSIANQANTLLIRNLVCINKNTPRAEGS